MDLRQLRYFRAVARAGGISEAARQLRMSQPALTIALNKLEKDVGATLLVRDQRGAHLTTSGRELLLLAGQALALLDLARQRVAGLERDPAGRFVIGCPESLAAYLLPGFMRAFVDAHPGIELEVWNGASRKVEAAVLAREVQYGVVTHPVAHPDLVLVQLYRDSVDVLVLDDGRVGTRWREAVAHLQREPLVYVGSVPQSIEIIDRLAARRLLPARRIDCGGIELVKSLALAGTGVAVLPRRVAAYGHPGRLRRLHPKLPSIADTIRLIYRADMHRTRAGTLLKDALVAHGRTLDERAR